MEIGGRESESPHLNSHKIEFPQGSLWGQTLCCNVVHSEDGGSTKLGVRRPSSATTAQSTASHGTNPFISPDLSFSTCKMSTVKERF